MIELMYLKELILIKQLNKKDLLFGTIDKGLKFQPDAYNRCYDVLMMSVKLNDIAILSIQGVYYNCIIIAVSKIDAVNLLQNGHLTKERVVL